MTYDNSKTDYDRRHGGPFDRGDADRYYRRSYNPHYYVEGTGTSELVPQSQMSLEEIEAYYAGYHSSDDYKN